MPRKQSLGEITSARPDEDIEASKEVPWIESPATRVTSPQQRAQDPYHEQLAQRGPVDIDPELNAALVRKQDGRIIPLAAGIYLLCYLDRSNIGNAKVLNAAAHHDLLSETRMTNYQYTVALMVFLIAYALFEVPSNYFLKTVRPSRWIAFLMLAWGSLTMGLAGTKSYASVTAVRFLLGVFEAGEFPPPPPILLNFLVNHEFISGTMAHDRFELTSPRTLPWPRLLSHVLVPDRGAIRPGGRHPRIGHSRGCLWRSHRVRRGTHGPDAGPVGLAMAFPPRGSPIRHLGPSRLAPVARLPGNSLLALERGEASRGEPPVRARLPRQQHVSYVAGSKVDASRVASLGSLLRTRRTQPNPPPANQPPGCVVMSF